ncbi:MAG: rod shape-determining protein MreC [Ruminococcaceae bacterium]|nr:rod shape-determining protein MreC [Oscillospiraceae bacterium]
MKNFLKNNGLWILFAGAVVAVALAVMSVFSANSSPLVNAAETITAPLRFVSTAVANWFNDRQNYYRDTTALEAENAELRRRLAEMEAAVRQAEKDSAENARLRELLELRKQRRDLTSDMEAAFVTEHAVTNWTSSLTLDKGTRHGVESGDCVIDETGALVGVISECGTNWSTVLTIIDTDVSLGAQVFRTKDLGLAQGNFSLMGQNRLRLDYLPTECRLLSGDLVVSSGLGGYFPAGLVIGSVEEVQRNDAGSASYAILIPSVDFDALEEVFIIKSFDIVT